MKKIAIITAYYGKLHNYFNFWKKSVEYNASIDFLLFTDLEIINKPNNLIIYRMSFEEMKALIQSNFNFPIAFSAPYKICDFRPAFGQIFSSYIKDYDFWGYTDFDIIYGDLRHFLTEEVLSSYSKIFGRGHLSLMHNDDLNNNLFKCCSIPNYRSVFSFDINVAFDEYYGFSRYYDKINSKEFYQAILSEDIDCMQYEFHSHMKKKKDSNKKNIIYEFINGKLYKIYELNGKVSKEECMCVHFQKRPMQIKTTILDSFMMIPNSFIPHEENISTERLYQLGHRINFYPYKYKLIWNRIKTKWQKIQCKKYNREFGKPQLPTDGGKYYIEP